MCPHVLVDNRLLPEPFPTDSALKRLLAGVLSHVNFQMSCLLESFSAILAVERPFKDQRYNLDHSIKKCSSPDGVVLTHVLHQLHPIFIFLFTNAANFNSSQTVSEI